MHEITPAAANQSSSDVLVARQPIYDQEMNVAAYELLLHGATAGTLTEIGMNIVAGHVAYVKVGRAFLLEGFAEALPADRVVFQITPEVGIDEQTVDALQQLVAGGFSIALDGFTWDEPVRPLVAIAKTVKLDVAALEGGLLREQVALMGRSGAKLLAGNVESHEELAFAESLGFHYYQGYFFCKPRIVEKGASGLQVNALNKVKLVAELQQPDMELRELEVIISRDVGLSYNLLRFVNSAFFSIPRRVGSIGQALVMLGQKNVRKWATLMALADTQDKPDELLVTGLIRARMCELIAADWGEKDQDGFFTTGLFSIVDALMDASLVEVLASLPLSPEVINGLLRYKGPPGEALRASLAYEQANVAELGTLRGTSVPLADLYSQAVEWATEASGGLSAPDQVEQ